MTSPLRIHADPAYLPPGEPHVLMLYPWWGRSREHDVPRPDFADRYLEQGRGLFELTSLRDADVAVFPQDWKRGLHYTPETLVERAEVFAAEARAAGKRYLVFRDGDLADPVPLDGALVVRQSLFRSRRGPLEHAQPAFFEDLAEYVGGAPVPREYRERPTIGFCGVALAPAPERGLVRRLRGAAAGVKRRVRERLGLPAFQDIWVRQRAIDALRRQDAVDTNIVLREGWGGGAFAADRYDADRWRRTRQEFVDNVVGSDYTLCARGHGNFSYRLFETLCLGRIPVFVDTDCVLPFDFAVEWRDHCVWVDRTEIPRIGEKVAEFHSGLSPAEFVERQQACRRLWEEYLSPEGFFAHFHLLVDGAQ